MSPSSLRMGECWRAGGPLDTSPMRRYSVPSASCCLMICGLSNTYCERVCRYRTKLPCETDTMQCNGQSYDAACSLLGGIEAPHLKHLAARETVKAGRISTESYLATNEVAFVAAALRDGPPKCCLHRCDIVRQVVACTHHASLSASGSHILTALFLERVEHVVYDVKTQCQQCKSMPH